MNYKLIIDQLWKDYTQQNKAVAHIYELFSEIEEKVINDHIALRTFNDKRINIEVLATPFIKAGYVAKAEYDFPVKKLRAVHFEHLSDPEAPLVFISELKLEECSHALQEKVHCILKNQLAEKIDADTLIYNKDIFGMPSYDIYKDFLEESEYAAWLYINGFRANHFTVSVNHNKVLNSIEKVNDFLTEKGYKINTSGGAIKGSPEQLLEQSSILAERIMVQFKEYEFMVPGCYYEFARRYPDKDDNLFKGFIAGSADKIFESTNT